jgi:S1-C subfamily serine protease
LKNRVQRALGALVFLGACGPALAVDTKPPAVPPQVPAVSVESLGLTARFAVDRLKTALLPGDEIGHVSLGWFCNNRQPVRISEQVVKNSGAYETSVATQLLKKNGFPMASLGSASAYSSDVAAAPDYRLGGIIREVKFDTCRTGEESEGWFYVKIDWALYSEREQKVVVQLTVEGLATSEKKVPDLSRRAVTSAVEGFIGSPEFLEAIKPGSVALLAARPASAAAATPGAEATKPAAPTMDKPPAVAALVPLKADPQSLKVRLGVDPVKMALLPGDPLGTATFGGFCGNPQPLTVSDALLKNYGNFVATVTQQALKKNGYTLASQARTSAFDTEQAAAPDFRVGGVLRELQMLVCHGVNVSEGWIRAKIDWALYSEKAKRVVFQHTTEGLFFTKEKIPDLGSRAITAAVENLLASPELMAALKADPAAVAQAAAPASAASAGEAATPRALQLAGGAPMSGGAQKNQARLRAAVVTLETAQGSGSGFYIDRQGYLLTNFHVVSGAKFVKVKMLNGDRMVAEVVKVNEREDVALLKSLPVELEPLAVRPDTLDVGEEVFAIGTPLGVLDSTMTRGVLSADRVTQGVRVLQSDAAVTFGSSGGPLLDGEGRVIGITKGGMRGAGGFNFFIPVDVALKALDVAVGAR